MTDKAADWAAYIGALAWIPQIASWIWRALLRPVLRVRTARNISIGYGGLGAVVGLNMALSADKKDALIGGMVLRLVHENGDTRDLAWNWATENQVEWQNDSGERARASRTQSVLALKVTTQSLTERFVSFGDDGAVRRILDAQAAARVEYQREVAQGPIDWNQYVNTPAAAAVGQEVERRFWWQEGRYRATVRCSMVGVSGDHAESFQFTLTREDIDEIRRNIRLWGDNLRAVLGITGEFPAWTHRYPEFRNV